MLRESKTHATSCLLFSRLRFIIEEGCALVKRIVSLLELNLPRRGLGRVQFSSLMCEHPPSEKSRARIASVGGRELSVEI